MKSDALTFTKITGLQDALLLPWLELYETAFPAEERVLVAKIISILKPKQQGKANENHLLAATGTAGEFTGLAMFSAHPEFGASFFWYLAVIQKLRGTGIGSQLYQEVLRRARGLQAGTLVIEVEIPDGKNAAEALRRMHFYQKQGALRLSGVDYLQKVGWHQAPIPMWIMIHPEGSMQGKAAYQIAKSVLGDSIRQTGPLRLAPFLDSDAEPNQIGHRLHANRE